MHFLMTALASYETKRRRGRFERDASDGWDGMVHEARGGCVMNL